MSPGAWDGLVVIAAGVSWDDPWMSEKHLAHALSEIVPVLYVDPPVSVLTPLRKRHLAPAGLRSQLRVVRPGLARLTPVSLPGVARPGLRVVAAAATRRAIRRATRELGADVDALVVASFDDVLDACPARTRVLWGTDDWVAGAELMGISRTWLERLEQRQVPKADLVVAVSQPLADRWEPLARSVVLMPNGVDAARLRGAPDLQPASDVRLPAPIAGFVGHISERIDVGALEAVARAGHSLLLVGPRQATFDLARLDALLAMPNVQWTGPRASDDLPHYLRAMSVGLTPYADTAFNRSSFPLKTIEYLAAGLPVVASDLPASRSLPREHVTLASDAEDFAAATGRLLAAGGDAAAVQRRQSWAAEQSWSARAEQLVEAIGRARAAAPDASLPTRHG